MPIAAFAVRGICRFSIHAVDGPISVYEVRTLPEVVAGDTESRRDRPVGVSRRIPHAPADELHEDIVPKRGDGFRLDTGHEHGAPSQKISRYAGINRKLVVLNEKYHFFEIAVSARRTTLARYHEPFLDDRERNDLEAVPFVLEPYAMPRLVMCTRPAWQKDEG